jgi:hypothetical protein
VLLMPCSMWRYERLKSPSPTKPPGWTPGAYAKSFKTRWQLKFTAVEYISWFNDVAVTGATADNDPSPAAANAELPATIETLEPSAGAATTQLPLVGAGVLPVPPGEVLLVPR